MLTIWNQLSHSVFVFKKLLKMRMVKEIHDIWSAENKYKGKIRKYRNGTLKKKKRCSYIKMLCMVKTFAFLCALKHFLFVVLKNFNSLVFTNRPVCGE